MDDFEEAVLNAIASSNSEQLRVLLAQSSATHNALARITVVAAPAQKRRLMLYSMLLLL